MAITERTPNGTTPVSYGTRTNTTVSRPLGMVAGDFALVSMTCGGSSLAQPTNASATLIDRVTYMASDPWYVDLSLWLVDYAAGSSWTWLHASRSTQAWAEAFVGVDPITPLDVAATKANKDGFGGSATPSAGSHDIATAGALGIVIRGSWDGNAIAPPSGWTEDHDQPVLWVGTREWTTTGPTGAVTVPSGNSGNGPWGIVLGALRPAGAAAATSPPLPNPVQRLLPILAR